MHTQSIVCATVQGQYLEYLVYITLLSAAIRAVSQSAQPNFSTSGFPSQDS